MLSQVVFLLLTVTSLSSALFIPFWQLFTGPAWDNLKVTWGLNPFTNFNPMPRTVSQALNEGFASDGECDASPTAQFRGSRYVKNGDQSLALLFDVNGYIAGIQTVIPDGLPNNYPESGLTPPFVKAGPFYYHTAYFVEPELICTRGRSSQEFVETGTGSVLLIQNGTNPDTNYMTIPTREQDLATTKWVQGECFFTMGRHYWYDISDDMDCGTFFPVFLMYNRNKLNGFGWAIGADLTSPRFEHPPSLLFNKFITSPPRCLYDQGTLSTMHIFLTNRPATNWC